MKNVLYLLVCIVLAYSVYKSPSDKKRIAKSPMYAVFVGIWMSIFTIALLTPSAPLMTIHYLYSPIFLVTTTMWFMFPWIVRFIGKAPKLINDTYSSNFLLQFTHGVVFTKYAEILFQQSIFSYTLLIMLNGLSERNTLFVFFILNIILHFANLLFMDKKETMFFVYWSIPMGIAFGYLLLHGYIFVTLSIHMIFYLVVNGSLWIKKT